MANAAPAHQHDLACLFRAARRDTADRIVAQTQKVRLRFWTHWVHFTTQRLQVDPFLTNLPTDHQIPILQGFARFVREGHAGRGHQVRVGSVQDALCAIGKTFEQAGLPNPLHRPNSGERYWTPLDQQIHSYKREDPQPSPNLPFP